jgi:hypothetical protein
LNLEKLDK